MDEQQARQVLGLNDHQQWSEQFLELAAAREHIAILVRRAPNENIAARYQEELMEFDRAMALFREREASIRGQLIHEQQQPEDASVPSQDAASENVQPVEKTAD